MTDSTIAPRVAAKAEARLGNTAARWREAVSLREMGVYYALLLLVIVLSVTTTYLGRTNYLSVQNISNVLYQASLPALMSVSMTVVLVSGNFDLSVASVAALSAAVLMGTANSLGFPASLVLAMAASVAVGLINGAIVEFVGINAFIVTLGSLTAVRGLVLIYSDGKTMFVSEDRTIAAMKAFESGLIPVGYALAALGAVIAALGAVWTFADLRKGRGLRPASVGTAAAGLVLLGLAAAGHFEIKLAKPVLYMFAFAAFVWSVMSFTKYGRRLYAVGGNPEAARLSGINVRLLQADGVRPVQRHGRLRRRTVCKPASVDQPECVAGRGAHRHCGGNSRRHFPVRRKGKRRSLGHGRAAVVHLDQRIQHRQPWRQLSEFRRRNRGRRRRRHLLGRRRGARPGSLGGVDAKIRQFSALFDPARSLQISKVSPPMP